VLFYLLNPVLSKNLRENERDRINVALRNAFWIEK